MIHARIAGKGLMVGLELVLDEARTPAKDVRNATESHAIDNGLLLLGAGENTLRFIPALMIERDLVEEGLHRFDKALTEAEREAGLL
jgi:4-aminobutyrate aminotransferase-like enzyme